MIKILYLEDNKFDVDLSQREINNAFADSQLDITNTIEQAKRLVNNGTKYDVALLDLNLPDGNGMDILMHIREQNLPIPVVILTGSGNEESAIAALKAGADDYIAKKPGYLKKLPATLAAAIENYKRNLEKKTKQLNVLYIEWNKPDIEFTIRHMRKYAPYIHIETVARAEDALKKLPRNTSESGPYDLLLMDYRLPGLNALDTIKIIRQERKLTLPIVLVTGHGDEEVAVQTLKMGANEYLVKRDNYLFRLPSLLTGAFDHSELERRQIELRESEAKYRLLAENSTDIIFLLDLDLNYLYVSPAIKELLGYEADEMDKPDLKQMLAPGSLILAQKIISEYIPQKGKKVRVKPEPLIAEMEVCRKNGSTVWVEVKILVVIDENSFPVGIQGTSRDISKRKAAQDELLRSREEYKSFFEDDLTGDFISHVDGRMLNCNSAYLRMLGFDSLEELRNFNLNKVHISQEFRENMLDRIRKEKKLTWFEHDLIRKDGKIIHAIANIIGNFNTKGELETLKGYIIDDSERKKATEEIRKLSRAIEQSPASVIITDLDGNIEYVNPKFTEITGYSFEEVVGQKPRILKSDNLSREEYSILWNKITNGETWTGDFLNKRKDGTLFWEYASISPIKNNKGQTTHYLAVKEDITEKKKYEEELIAAKEKAEESDRLKSAFLANMSHEIRTPMNGILGFSSLLKDPGLSGSKQQAYIEIIEKSGARMLNTINDIMDISKIHAGQVKIKMSEIELNEQLDFLHNFFTPEFEKKGIRLFIKKGLPDHESKIKTDYEKLNSVLTNLVKNAIKFTAAGSIELGYSVKKHRDTFELEFYVKDTGIGIPENRIHAIFDRFVKADIEDKMVFEGSGLGLAISKAYVEILGGKIRVESQEGKGSVFYFTIPYKSKTAKETALNTSKNSELSDSK